MAQVRLVTSLALVGTVVWVGAMRAQAPAAPQAGAPPVVSAVILGKVVDGDTGAPVPEAVVTFGMRVAPQAARGAAPPGGMAPGANQVRLITTSEGKFVVRGVPAGPVQLLAAAPGYVNASHGQTRPNGPPQPFAVTADMKVAEVTLRIWRTAAITGIVTDDRGEPLPGIQVRGLRRSYMRGQPRLTASGFAQTDDRGVYRISGLVPGEYTVVVPQTQVSMPAGIMDSMIESVMGGSPNMAASLELVTSGAAVVPLGVRIGDMMVGTTSGQAPQPHKDGRWRVYTSRYFPGVEVPSQATVFALKSGEEKGAVDLPLALASTVTVSGVVVGPAGPMGNVGVRLRRPGESLVDDPTADVAAGTTRADGTFIIHAVPQGNYQLRVLRAARPTMSAQQMQQIPEEMRATMTAMMAKPGDDNKTLFAELPLSADRDVAGLTITLGTGATVGGRIEFNGTAAQPASLEGLQVSLTAVGGDWTSQVGLGLGAVTSGRVEADGTFVTSGQPPGRYVIALGGRMPPGWFLKSAIVNGRDASFESFDLEGRDVTNVVVTLTDKRSTISGTVQAPGTAGAESSVIIFPAMWREWIANGMSAQFVRLVRTPAAGTFSATGLFPREYMVVAVANAVAPDVTDPTAFEALSRLATLVTVGEGETKNATLRIVEVQR